MRQMQVRVTVSQHRTGMRQPARRSSCTKWRLPPVCPGFRWTIWSPVRSGARDRAMNAWATAGAAMVTRSAPATASSSADVTKWGWPKVSRPCSTSSMPPRRRSGSRVSGRISEREYSRVSKPRTARSAAVAHPPLPAPRTATLLMVMVVYARTSSPCIGLPTPAFVIPAKAGIQRLKGRHLSVRYRSTFSSSSSMPSPGPCGALTAPSANSNGSVTMSSL